MTSLPKHVSAFKDRHGKVRYRFRKNGRSRYIDADPGTAEFHTQIAECMIGVMPPKQSKAINYPEGTFFYFVSNGENAVKIGWSGNLRARMADLAVGSIRTLRLLAIVSGGPVMERHFHKTFAKQRIRGEWFERSPELDALIDELATHSKLDQKVSQDTLANPMK